MIADNFSVLTDNEITTIGIIPSSPFLAWHHAKSCAKKQNLHLVGIEILYVFAFIIKWILLCNFCTQ